MSGTSMDGIDAVLLAIEPDGTHVVAAARREWPDALRTRLRHAAEHPEATGLDELGALDVAVGMEFAAAAQAVLATNGDVRAVGHHGQTIRHRPSGPFPFTMQIGDPNVLAERLGVDVVADFRRRDVAAGGQGAPLAPAFHAAAFDSATESRVVVNVGGIANVTWLVPGRDVVGFDVGPGNCLLDAWSRRGRDRPFDRDGAWAATGTPDATLLERLLADPYFAVVGPKSTGREHFSDAWLDAALDGLDLAPADVQATLGELTACAVAAAVPPDAARVIVCGGGAFNPYLMSRLRSALDVPLQTTADFGLAPDHVEGAAFAWLAHRYLTGDGGNLPSVTGAWHPVPLGALYRGRPVTS
jgi:anhydro-N-acetylmuramic acid kinase